MAVKKGKNDEGLTGPAPGSTPTLPAAAVIGEDNLQRATWVIDRCDKYIAEFKGRANRMRMRNNIHRSVTVIAAGLTAVIAAVPELPKWSVVIPAAVASMASNFIVAFNFSDKYVNFDATCWDLEVAKTRFVGRMASNFEGALEEFISEVRVTVKAATGELRNINRGERQPSLRHKSPDEDAKP
jgi:hypothetical protein